MPEDLVGEIKLFLAVKIMSRFTTRLFIAINKKKKTLHNWSQLLTWRKVFLTGEIFKEKNAKKNPHGETWPLKKFNVSG